jgi:hypothetical protein
MGGWQDWMSRLAKFQNNEREKIKENWGEDTLLGRLRERKIKNI